MDIARFITMAGLVAGCALMIPIAIGAISELVTAVGTRALRENADREPLRTPEPVPYGIRSSGAAAGPSPAVRVTSLEEARALRAARDAA